MTLSELQAKIDEYFESCALEGVFPDEAGLLLYAGLAREQYDKYRASRASRTAGYRRALEAVRLRRESMITRGIYAYEKGVTGKIFLARQGLQEASADAAPPVRTLEVRLAGGEEFLK